MSAHQSAAVEWSDKDAEIAKLQHSVWKLEAVLAAVEESANEREDAVMAHSHALAVQHGVVQSALLDSLSALGEKTLYAQAVQGLPLGVSLVDLAVGLNGHPIAIAEAIEYEVLTKVLSGMGVV